MRENGMSKRQVGNYLKEYPHVYEAFRKDLFIKNVGVMGAIALLVMCIFIVLFIAVVTALYGAELCWYLCFFKNARKITDNATAILYK